MPTADLPKQLRKRTNINAELLFVWEWWCCWDIWLGLISCPASRTISSSDRPTLSFRFDLLSKSIGSPLVACDWDEAGILNAPPSFTPVFTASFLMIFSMCLIGPSASLKMTSKADSIIGVHCRSDTSWKARRNLSIRNVKMSSVDPHSKQWYCQESQTNDGSSVNEIVWVELRFRSTKTNGTVETTRREREEDRTFFGVADSWSNKQEICTKRRFFSFAWIKSVMSFSFVLTSFLRVIINEDQNEFVRGFTRQWTRESCRRSHRYDHRKELCRISIALQWSPR